MIDIEAEVQRRVREELAKRQRPPRDYKFLLRIPIGDAEVVRRRARRERVSINTWIVEACRKAAT